MLEVIHRPKYRLTGKKLPPIKSKLIKRDEFGNAIYLGRKNEFLYVTTKDHRKWIIPIDKKEVEKRIEPWEDILLINVECHVSNQSSEMLPLPYAPELSVTSVWSIYTKAEGTVVGALHINTIISLPLMLHEKSMLEISGHTKIHDAFIVNPDSVFYAARKINTKKEEE